MRKIFSLHKVMYRNLSEYMKEAMMALNPQDIKPHWAGHFSKGRV